MSADHDGELRRGCCPMDSLLRTLAGPWTMYIVWVLRSEGPTRFGVLKRRIEGISARVLAARLRLLEAEGFVKRDYEPTVPPQVTYSLTPRAHALNPALDQLNALAVKWYAQPTSPGARKPRRSPTRVTAAMKGSLRNKS